MSLASEVLSSLNEAEVGADVRSAVLGAVQGEDALQAVLDGDLSVLEEAEAGGDDQPDQRKAYLSSIEVTGFRGVGPVSKLELTPGPGLTVVAGRNGSGKSSFADALEVLLTGDSWRWKDKTADWKQGWRNLHKGDEPKVSAEFHVEGNRGPTTMWREWDDSAKDATVGETIVQTHGEKQTDLDGIGWSAAMELYRPLLSHSELGVVASNPSSLFDALTGVLGVEPLLAGSQLLRSRRLDLEKALKDAKKRLKDEILPMLSESDDSRASTAADALGSSKWDLEAVEGLAAGTSAPDPGIQSLRQLTNLKPPSTEEVESLADRLENVLGEVERLEEAEAGRAARTADILQLALDEHSDHGDAACPVCGKGRLDDDWRELATGQLEELNEVASSFRKALKERDATVREVRPLVEFELPTLENVDLDTSALTNAASVWRELPSEVEEMSGHLRERLPALVEALDAIVDQAKEVLKAREDEWIPIAVNLSSWVELARRGQAEEVQARQLKLAEQALTHATEQIRAQRFEPISKQAIALWESLRLQSNVHLREVALAGSGTRRRVDLLVTVDDEEAAALGVVSQGEVNCLALSLFFPRVMLEESPFRFIVIDDPIQAMDPARVDGLAKVFAEVAKDRQLVVFTHDDRLPEALRRLGLPHTLLQVTRRPDSVVAVTESLDPVAQYFLDARAVAKDDDLPVGVASRVVPGFCRSGIEAACLEAVRRRRIGLGEAHHDVESLLIGLKTTELASLALFDDESQGGKVLGEINKKWGKAAGDAYRDCQRGVHKGFAGSLVALLDESQRLAVGLRSQ